MFVSLFIMVPLSCCYPSTKTCKMKTYCFDPYATEKVTIKQHSDCLQNIILCNNITELEINEIHK